MTAPFSPFLSEITFKEIKDILQIRDLSVHLIQMPKEISKVETDIMKDMKIAMDIINIGRKIRTKEKISFKRPIKELVIISPNIESISEEISEIIYQELNIIDMHKRNENKYMKYRIIPNYKKAGKAK